MIINHTEDSLEVEQSVIGGLLKISDPSSDLFIRAMSIIKESSFYASSHRKIFKAVKQIALSGDYVDLVTLSDRIEKNGDNESAGGLTYIAEIMRATPSAENIVAYCNLVRDYAV